VIEVRRRTGGRGSWAVAVLLSGVVLTGCGNDGYEPAGPFRPLPEGAPPEVAPPSSRPPVPGQPAEPGSGDDQGDPNVVASQLSVPTGLTLMPDGSALVGERDTGRIVQVFPDRSPARELMTVPGIDTSGDGGLLGLALSPTFLEDGLVYAYMTTPTDNRVVRFPIGGTPNELFTGIPRGAVHNGGALVFDADGNLLVGTGDAGDPALAADPDSTAGKVLRIDVFGKPIGGSAVFSRGHRDVTAICPSGEDAIYAIDAAIDPATTGPDEINNLRAGADYTLTPPLAEVPAEEGGLGGCTAAGGAVFLAALDGERVHALSLDEAGTVVGDPEQFLDGEYGRLRTVVLDAEGALWITTSNRDGVGTPAEDDDKVLRILPPSSAGNSPL
jgi:glucose/arabinose dehydrogenase